MIRLDQVQGWGVITDPGSTEYDWLKKGALKDFRRRERQSASNQIRVGITKARFCSESFRSHVEILQVICEHMADRAEDGAESLSLRIKTH
jgi:hypothetical protein